MSTPTDPIAVVNVESSEDDDTEDNPLGVSAPKKANTQATVQADIHPNTAGKPDLPVMNRPATVMGIQFEKSTVVPLPQLQRPASKPRNQPDAADNPRPFHPDRTYWMIGGHDAISPVTDVAHPPENTILIYRTNTKAKLPQRMTVRAAGYDICSLIETCIQPMDGVWLRTGIIAKFPALMYLSIEPRSSLAQQRLLCHHGTIDSDYDGEILIFMFNLTPNAAIRIPVGVRIAQLIPRPIIPILVVEIKEGPNPYPVAHTGFGSTGVF